MGKSLLKGFIILTVCLLIKTISHAQGVYQSGGANFVTVDLSGQFSKATNATPMASLVPGKNSKQVTLAIAGLTNKALVVNIFISNFEVGKQGSFQLDKDVTGVSVIQNGVQQIASKGLITLTSSKANFVSGRYTASFPGGVQATGTFSSTLISFKDQ